MMIGVITLRNGPQPGRNHRQSSTSISLFSFLTAISLTSPTDKQEPKEKEEKPRVLKTPQDRENGETVQRRRARDCTRNEATTAIKKEAERTNCRSPIDGPVKEGNPEAYSTWVEAQYSMGLWGRKVGLEKDKNIGKNGL
ncbi:hypothetical protein M9H77_02008 [Catharanthus roseus]|uniref:Uncharacterized protein n=1 Tax=Catharanthus roseus TaxID=4058 RepID=A0ACC0C782_CATRO|nr:hypothetical protein M9H77_02008 [Catharanthus roseus]